MPDHRLEALPEHERGEAGGDDVQQRPTDRCLRQLAQRALAARRARAVTERELPGDPGDLLGTLRAADLAIEDPPLEEILRVMFGRSREAAAS